MIREILVTLGVLSPLPCPPAAEKLSAQLVHQTPEVQKAAKELLCGLDRDGLLEGMQYLEIPLPGGGRFTMNLSQYRYLQMLKVH